MKGGAFMNFYANIMKEMLDFPKKIRHLIISSVQFSSVQFSSVQFSSVTRGTPSLCKIQQSLFIILRRSFSAIAL